MLFRSEETIDRIFKERGSQIQSEVLAVDIIDGGVRGYGKEWNINGETVTLGVEKV